MPSIEWRGDTLIALDLMTSTDDSLSAAQMVLVWDNPALRLDSVILNVGRWNVPGYHRWTMADNDTGVAIAFMPTQKRLPPGSGPVARLYFGRDSAYTFDSDFAIISGELPATPPLATYQTLFSDVANEPFLPGLIEQGVVAYSPCFCSEHGDISDEGTIDALDLNMMIMGIFFNGPTPPIDPDCPHIHRGDYSCDNAYDAVDLNQLIEYIFFNGTTLCDPCEDLP
ncbi:MAG: hypothetical protein GF341_11235 [candidate division Zixibacteria bacterium]|nr:hypothetical protein [candidate division Zixibacteria bacterium]